MLRLRFVKYFRLILFFNQYFYFQITLSTHEEIQCKVNGNKDAQGAILQKICEDVKAIKDAKPPQVEEEEDDEEKIGSQTDDSNLKISPIEDTSITGNL